MRVCSDAMHEEQVLLKGSETDYRLPSRMDRSCKATCHQSCVRLSVVDPAEVARRM